MDGGRDALDGKGPRRRPQRRLHRRLEGVAEAVGGGYCRLQMPLSPALGVRGTAAGQRVGALERGERVPPPFQCIPLPPPPPPDRLLRYDAVAFLVTAADGALEYYSKQTNVHRLEDADEAREVDQNLRMWYSRPPAVARCTPCRRLLPSARQRSSPCPRDHSALVMHVLRSACAAVVDAPTAPRLPCATAHAPPTVLYLPDPAPRPRVQPPVTAVAGFQIRCIPIFSLGCLRYPPICLVRVSPMHPTHMYNASRISMHIPLLCVTA